MGAGRRRRRRRRVEEASAEFSTTAEWTAPTALRSHLSAALGSLLCATEARSQSSPNLTHRLAPPPDLHTITRLWGGGGEEKEERRREGRDEPIAGRCPVVGSVKRRHGGVGGGERATDGLADRSEEPLSPVCAKNEQGERGEKKRGGSGRVFSLFFLNGCPIHSPTHSHTHTHTQYLIIILRSHWCPPGD